MDATKPKRRWFLPSPGHLVIAILVIECALWLSDWLDIPHWHKGYAALAGVASMAVGAAVMFVWLIAALVFRWRFQFGIKSLLVMAVVVALPFSWVRMLQTAAVSERKVANEFMELGGDVYYDDEVFAEGETVPGFSLGHLYYVATGRECGRQYNDPTEPQWLRDWLGEDYFRGLVTVEFINWAQPTTAAGLQRLISLSSLKRLCLDNFESLTDADLAIVCRLQGLERLFLKATKITDSGLRELTGLTNLRYLSLAKTKITDDGLASLAGMTKLEVLELSETDISDEGLMRLRGLTSLRTVYVDGTKVTTAGAHQLEAALPHCSVLFCGPGVVG
jgi:hypothetical protein